MANTQVASKDQGVDPTIGATIRYYREEHNSCNQGWGGILINGEPYIFDPLSPAPSLYLSSVLSNPAVGPNCLLPQQIGNEEPATFLLTSHGYRLDIPDWSAALTRETLNSMDWVEYLDSEDRVVMETELIPLLRAAVATGDWRPYRDALYAWHSTADILSDPDLVASLNAPIDPAEEVQLKRP